MAKYAVGYVIAFLVLAVVLTGFIGFRGSQIIEPGRPGVVNPGFPEPALPPPDTGP